MGTQAAAFGGFLFQQLPFLQLGAGLQTPYATILPPAARVAAYVRSGGPADGDEDGIKKMIVTTLAAALRYARSGRGDTIYVLPGHSENVTDATMFDNLVAGTKIIGIGHGSNLPTFRWTNTAGQWTIDQADCLIAGLRLRMEGANGITKAVNITAADAMIQGCDIEVASGATAKAAIAIEVGSAALRCSIVGSRFRGTETHNATDVIKVVGGTVPSDLYIAGNKMIASATAGNGLIHITVAVKRALIEYNLIYNTHTASTACVAVDAVAADGAIRYNDIATINDGVATAQGLTFGAGSLFRCFQNFSADEPNKSGVLTPAAVAT